MKLTADQYELIEAYLSGRLAPADRAEVEADRQNDPEFDLEIRLQEELREGFRALRLDDRLQTARQRYQARMEPIESNRSALSSEKPKQIRWGWSGVKTWAAAASVVFVVGVSVWVVWQREENQGTDMAYSQNYQPDPADFVARALPAELKPTERVALEKGLQSYNQGRYRDAIRLFRQVTEGDSSLTIATYYLGISYLTTPEVDKAIGYLQVAQRSPNRILRRKAQWYLALAYLKKADRPGTQRSLRVVADDAQSPYQQRAEALLEQLFESGQ